MPGRAMFDEQSKTLNQEHDLAEKEQSLSPWTAIHSSIDVGIVAYAKKTDSDTQLRSAYESPLGSRRESEDRPRTAT